MKKLSYIILFLFPAFGFLHAQVLIKNLRCEMLVNPIGIDEKKPRLSWQINSDQRNVQQTAYHIIVSSSKEKLNKNEGDLWNPGKINYSQSIHITYAGKSLASKTYCYWKIKVYTNKGESAWSEPAYWSMGLLNKSDPIAIGWEAKWIGYDKASPWDSITQWSRLSARYFRKEFQLSSHVKRATVYIVGLGLYELYLNGKKIGNQVLAPSPTDYRKSVLYNTHDVTKQVRAGDNAIATVLGNGRFFTMRQNYKTHKHNTFGYPKMLLQLEIEYKNGTKKTIISNETWKLNVDGPIRTNNEYDGEEYDATKEFSGWTDVEFDDTKWLKPQLVKAPGGKIVAQMSEPMKIMKTISPVSVKNIGSGKYILDMGQNFSGWIKLRNITGKKGDKISLRFAESLQLNGELYVANLRDAKVTDVYTFGDTPLGDGGWQPSFVYHGFRYVEITGYPGEPTVNDFEGQFIYDNLQTTGSFQCSDTTINKIYRNAWWGIASNYKGMPVDCPQRNERQPWLGDRTTGAAGEAFAFDNANLYTKWLDDIEQSQTAEGAIPDVAPAFWNYYSDNITWPAAYFLIADMLYRQYGDERPIIKHYPSMKKWMNYMKRMYMKDFIITKDKYGDWCVPPESLEMIRSRDSLRTTNGELIATAYYYHLLQLMKKFALLSGNDNDVAVYDALRQDLRTAFNEKFYYAQHSCYDNNTVTANLLPLYFGMVPGNQEKNVFNNIYERIKIKDNMHISTGVIGTQWLMRGLTDNGQAGMAYALASTKTYPGWGYMTEQGATTIWELWNGNTASPQMNSQNHVMLLGDLLIWLYEDLAGICSDDKGIAFKQIIMKPSFPDGLNEVKASYESVYGMIGSHWKKESGNLLWKINIPVNTKAVIHIPAANADEVSEGNNPASDSEGIRFIKIENNTAVFEIGSGSYSFTSQFSNVK